MQNGAWRRCKATFVGRASSGPNISDRLISRFFLDLRSVAREGLSTLGSPSVNSTAVSRPRTHPLQKRVKRVTTGFSLGPEVEMKDYSNGNKRDISAAATVDLELAMEMRNRYDGSDNDM
jgi:hypothetical protein